MYFVLILLAVVAILFATDKIRPDFIALAALCILILSGILKTNEALAAFGNSTVIMVAALFIVGKALSSSGVTQMLGNFISSKVKKGQDNKLTGLLMASVALLSSFMSSTGVVSLFVPVVRKIATNNQVNIKKLLLPIAYAGLISGMTTLIATPPNLIVAEELENSGYVPFSMLAFTPIGITVLVAGIAYFFAKNKFTGKEDKATELDSPTRRLDELRAKYNIEDAINRVQIKKGSTLIGKMVKETQLRNKYGVNVLGLEIKGHLGKDIAIVSPETTIVEDDILYLLGTKDEIKTLCENEKIEELAYEGVHQGVLSQQLGFAEIIIPFNSPLIGLDVGQIGFKHLHNLIILGSRKFKETSTNNLKKHKVSGGETLLICGRNKEIEQISEQKEQLIVYNIPFEQKSKVNTQKATTALAITALMIIMLIVNIIPSVLVVLVTSLLLIATKCVNMDQAYKSISWSTVVLVAAMMPFAAALSKTGGVDLIVNNILGLLGNSSPYLIFTCIFLLTVLLSLFISNTATAVILAPISIQIAEQASVSPYPLAMAVAIAASTAFITPVSSPVNMLVVSPGGYKFMDFVRNGLPMALITFLISVLLIPLLFPF